MIWVGTIRGFFREYIHFDPIRAPSGADWLLFPSQKLLSITSGQIFQDDLGLSRVRSVFGYYPRDVWLHLLSVEWLRLSEAEAFVGRTAAVGDQLGARLLAARQVRLIMRLAFLQERQYYPYEKWFGTAFRRLKAARTLLPILERALEANTATAREASLSAAYEFLARRQNAMRLGRRLPVKVSRFHDRPYLVIHAATFAASIRGAIQNESVRRLPRLGSVDQFAATEELGTRKEQLLHLRRLVAS